jgi:NADPH2:quinone reductase
MFELVLQGKIKPLIGQRFPLDQVAKAHEELAGRRTTGSTVLTLD